MQLVAKYKQYTIRFVIGAAGYGLVEILWRGHTHWSMLIAGGICFVLFSLIEERFTHLRQLYKCILCSGAVTLVELVFGCIFNLLLHQQVWDYSRIPFNLAGQICLLYSVLWGFLSAAVLPLAGKINRYFHAQAWE